MQLSRPDTDALNFLVTHEFGNWAQNQADISAKNWATSVANEIKQGGVTDRLKTQVNAFPSHSVQLRKSGFHDEAKLLDDFHAQHTAAEAAKKAATAAATPPAPAPTPAAAPAMAPYVSPLLQKERKAAVMAFIRHPNAKPVLDAHRAFAPGLDVKEAYKRANAAYESHHALNAQPEPAAQAAAATPQNSPQVAAPQPSATVPSPAPTAATQPQPAGPAAYVPRGTQARLDAMKTWHGTPEGKKAFESSGASDPNRPMAERSELAHAAYDQAHGIQPGLTEAQKEQLRTEMKRDKEPATNAEFKVNGKNVSLSEMAALISKKPQNDQPQQASEPAGPTAPKQKPQKPIGPYVPPSLVNHGPSLSAFYQHPDAQAHIEHHGVNATGIDSKTQKARLQDAYADFHGMPYVDQPAPKAQAQRQSGYGRRRPTGLAGLFGQAMANLSQPKQKQAAGFAHAARLGQPQAAAQTPAASAISKMPLPAAPKPKGNRYQYEAMNNLGDTHQNEIFAPSEDDARNQIAKRGLAVTGISTHVPRNHADRGKQMNNWANMDAGAEALKAAGMDENSVRSPAGLNKAHDLFDEFHGVKPQESAAPIQIRTQPTGPSQPGRFSQLIAAAKQGKLKDHLENGLGNFFAKFEKHGNKLLNKLGIQTDDDQQFSRSEIEAFDFLLNDTEFARRHKPSDRQRGFVFPEFGDVATAPATRDVIGKPKRPSKAPAKGQHSLTWDESKVSRESTEHDGKHAGEFAPKDEQQPEKVATEEATEPGSDAESSSKTAEKFDNFVARGNEVFDLSGKRHAAFRTEEKAKAAAADWNANGKYESPVVKKIEQQFPSLAGFTEPEEKPPTPGNAQQLEGDAKEKHLAHLRAMAEAYDKKKAESAFVDVTPAGYGPTEGKKPEPQVDQKPADKPEGAAGSEKSDTSEEVSEAEQSSNFNKLADFGEKIGGARKDTAVSTGPKGTKKATDGPGWKSRYEVGQIAGSTDKGEVGKWSVTDKKKTDWMGQPRQIGKFDTKEQAEAAIPLAEVARNHSVTNLAKKGEAANWAIYRKVSDRKHPTIKDGFATSDDAMKYMAKNPVEIIETKTRIDDSIHPQLEKIVRKGDEHRKGNVEENDFNKFGFRGVEFGNWNNNAERQHIVNHAYDSLTDMAKILDVPDKALSLDGDLGIGFGSRGHGLSGAKAHYEPDYVAINLTKMKGAGSLAHEWWHAFDHWVGRLSGTASSEWLKRGSTGDSVLDAKGSADYPSHGFHWKKKEGFRKEVEEAFKNVMDKIQNKEVQYVEDPTLYEKVHERYGSGVDQHLTAFRAAMQQDYSKDKYQYYKGKKGQPASPEVMKQVDDLIDKIKADDFGEDVYHGQNDALKRMGHRMAGNVAKLADLHKQLRGNVGYSNISERLSGVIADIASAVSQRKYAMGKLAEAKEQKVKTKKGKTDFVAEAAKMDLGTKGDYWGEPHELAARSFESYIYDKIKSAGNRDDFLAHEKHNNLMQYRLLGVKPYPEGKERSEMNDAFDNLFEVMRGHELTGTKERQKTERVLPVDDGTWEGHWGSKGATPAQIAQLKRRMGANEGVVHVNKKGSQATFYTSGHSTMKRHTVDELLAHPSLTKKPGKLFPVRKQDPQEFSRQLTAAYFAITGERVTVSA